MAVQAVAKAEQEGWRMGNLAKLMQAGPGGPGLAGDKEGTFQPRGL